jgi:hypothetical protein
MSLLPHITYISTLPQSKWTLPSSHAQSLVLAYNNFKGECPAELSNYVTIKIIVFTTPIKEGTVTAFRK